MQQSEAPAFALEGIGYSSAMSAIETRPVSGAPTPARRLLLATLRSLGLISAADALRRFKLSREDAADNAAFCAEHPDFAAPPIDFIYEVTGRPALRPFAASGRAACTGLAALADACLDAPLKRVLDWGVGPARVARWWRTVRPQVEIHGGDPWEAAIDWGKTALPEIVFHRLPAQPPTTLPDGGFDLVYGISILTHLPLHAQRAWLGELRRIIRPGGLLALTLQGRQGLARLTAEERRRWDAGEMVERAQVQEGSRLYLAYHPPGLLKDDLFADWEIVLHQPDSVVGSGGQDLWLLRRSGENARTEKA